MTTDADVQIAKKIGKPIAVISRTGLYEVGGTGTVKRVFAGTKWMDKPKGQSAKSTAKNSAAILALSRVPGIPTNPNSR